MSVKGYLAPLVGVFVVALAVVGVSQRATAGAMPAILVPVAVTLAAVALAVLLIRLVLPDIARPFHSAGVDIRSNAEQSSGVAQTSATMEELARAAASIADTVDQVATQADTTRHNLVQAEFDIRASGERTLALADRVGEIGVTIALINEIADQTSLLSLNAAIEAARALRRPGALAAARGPGGPAPARPEARAWPACCTGTGKPSRWCRRWERPKARSWCWTATAPPSGC